MSLETRVLWLQYQARPGTARPGTVDNGSAGSDPLDEQKVLEAVQRGVTEANQKFGTNFRVAQLQYVPTDTPDLSAYCMLAKKIVEQAWTDASLSITGVGSR